MITFNPDFQQGYVKMVKLILSYFSATYKNYDDEFWCDVAKHAVSHGARPTTKMYGVSESKVCGFVKSLKRQQDDNPDVDFIALPQNKRGPSKAYLEETDEKVNNLIKSMQELGSVINYNIMITIAQGIVIGNDRTLL